METVQPSNVEFLSSKRALLRRRRTEKRELRDMRDMIEKQLRSAESSLSRVRAARNVLQRQESPNPQELERATQRWLAHHTAVDRLQYILFSVWDEETRRRRAHSERLRRLEQELPQFAAQVPRTPRQRRSSVSANETSLETALDLN